MHGAAGAPAPDVAAALEAARAYVARVEELQARHARGEVRASVPAALREFDRPLDDLVEECLPASHAALEAASMSLFYSLPIAFDPGESVGCYLATLDRDEKTGEPYRFIDLGALIATQACGENDPAIVASVLRSLPFAVNRYAHSEYQTVLSLRHKAALGKIAPRGTPRHFVVNTGAEAVENAIKAVLLNRVRTAGEKDGGFIISFDGAFHGRTLGALAVTHRKKAKTGFPTFEWPQAPFPTDDPAQPAATARREEKSLRGIWELLVTGRIPKAEKPPKEQFKRELDRIDAFLESGGDPESFVNGERGVIGSEILRRARRVAAVLVEPVQGEGGVRTATPRFFRRLRMLTRIYDVPLVFDEVQTGWGMTGRLWAHERFELPIPPDVVTWAKKAQNGVLFVSDELATFFQEEKKFNTTWEGDSTGMLRLCALLEGGDGLLARVQATGAHARAGLEALAREYPELLQSVRGFGVMLAFDVARQDWRDVIRDRAFRRGLLLLPAGERALRFYPRYDTPRATIDEALEILRSAVEDVVAGSAPALTGPKIRVGELDCPLGIVQVIDIDARAFAEHRDGIMEVELERYGDLSHYPADVLKAGRRPLLQYPVEALEATVANARSLGVALRNTVSGRIIAYGLGSPIENYDETGVRDDPHFGEGNTFYLQAFAVLPSVRNDPEVENHLLNLIRDRVAALGFERISALMEERFLRTGPAWLRGAAVLRTVDNYLRSGLRFAYLQAEVPARRGAAA